MSGRGDKTSLEPTERNKSFAYSTAASPSMARAQQQQSEHHQHRLSYLCAALRGQAFRALLVCLKKSGRMKHASVRILA